MKKYLKYMNFTAWLSVAMVILLCLTKEWAAAPAWALVFLYSVNSGMQDETICLQKKIIDKLQGISQVRIQTKDGKTWISDPN